MMKKINPIYLIILMIICVLGIIGGAQSEQWYMMGFGIAGCVMAVAFIIGELANKPEE